MVEIVTKRQSKFANLRQERKELEAKKEILELVAIKADLLYDLKDDVEQIAEESGLRPEYLMDWCLDQLSLCLYVPSTIDEELDDNEEID